MAGAHWVVVLEADAQSSAGIRVIDVAWLQRLLEALPDVRPVALHCPTRYALQIQVDAPGEAEALRLAVARWRAAAEELGQCEPRLIRVEVLTLQEFERDCTLAYPDSLTPEEAQDPATTSRARLGDRLLREVFHDPLTQLPTRGLFMNHLEHALIRGLPAGGAPVVLAVELTGLGDVNERWGRAAGDEMLVTAARRLQAALPVGVELARISGGEFGVLLAGATDAVVKVATAGLDALREHLRIGDIEVEMSARAGIAYGRPGRLGEDLLAEARAARTSRDAAGSVGIYRAGEPVEHASERLPGVFRDPLGYLLLLQRAAMAANESSSLSHAAGLVVSQLCAHAGWSVGHLYVVEHGRLVPGGLSRLTTSRHPALLDCLDGLTLDPGQGLAGRVLETGQPAWVTDVGALAPRPWSSVATECGLNAALAFPVLVGREVVAVLEFFAEQAAEPDDALVEVLRCIGSQLGRVVERHRGAARLRASEDRLRETQALAQLGSWYVDVPRQQCTWTAELCDILGVEHGSPHTLDTFFALVHPDDRAQVQAATEEACGSGIASPTQFRIVRPDSQVRWVCTRIRSARDATGALTAIYGAMFDVTHVKAADDALRERERQLNMAEEVAELGSWERNLATDKLEWSDGMYRLWGARRDSFLPTVDVLIAQIHPDDRERIRETMKRAAETSGYVTDFRATPLTGRPRWFRGRATVQADERGRPARLVGTIQDVTKEKLDEAELRTSEERYRRIVETTHDGVWVIDADGLTTYVNERMADMLGRSPDEMIGKLLVDFLDDTAQIAFREREPGRRLGVVEQFETTVVHKDGSLVSVLVAANPLHDDEGRHVASLALLNDITGWRRR